MAGSRRDFDFWIGEWNVHDAADGTLAGTNSITVILDGRAIREQWRGADGIEGTSLNAYDERRDRWHQTWMDAHGTLLLLDGGLDEGGAMVLEGTALSARPETPELVVAHRITWTALGPDAVRQHWQACRDGGSAWATLFDGRYTRRL